MNINSLVVLVFIKSSAILIPKSSIVETNQTGLFNDTCIDIIALEKIDMRNIKQINVFSNNCLKSQFLCNNHYLIGNRGLNYDDLVRSATRISQRFDDPRFFNLLYLFCKNSLDLSDDMILSLNKFSYLIDVFTSVFELILSQYIF